MSNWQSTNYHAFESRSTAIADDELHLVDYLFFGGADRDRTGDPLLAKQVLSQLSYSPTQRKWWAWVESNYRPHPYQGCALAS